MSEATKNKATAAAICILLITLIEYSGNIVNPIVATIMADMPQYPANAIILIMTIPNVGFIFGPVIYSTLSRRHPTRLLVSIGLTIGIVFGTIPAWLGQQYYLILACRVLYGFGIGMIFTAPKVLINGNFNEKDGARLMGFSEVVGSAGMMMFQSLSGFLAVRDWHFSMYLHLLLLIGLAAIILLPRRNDPGSSRYVPAEGVVDIRVTEEEKTTKKSLKEMFPPIIWFYWLSTMGWMLAAFILLTNLSIYVDQLGLGDASDVGMMLTLNAFLGVVGGLIFGPLFKRIGDWTLPVAFFIAVLGFTSVSFSPSMFALYLGVGLMGFASPICISATFQLVGRRAPRETSALATSICISLQFAIQIVSPLFATAILKLLGVSTGDIRNLLIVGLVEFIILFTITVIVTARYRHNRRVGQLGQSAA